jgi:hypothetical protein
MSNNREIRKVEINFEAKGQKSVDQIGQSFDNVKAKAIGAATVASGQMAKSLKDVNQSAGLAGATLNSFAQGLGDAQYGFGAVANNISQLGSLFATLVGQTGGVMGALRSLGSVFMGPMGIMVLFQGAIAAINYFSSRTTKASKAAKEYEKAMKALNSEMASTVGELEGIRRGSNLQNMSDEQRIATVNRLNDKYKNLNLELDENNQLTDDSLNRIDLHIEKLKAHIKFKHLQAKAEKLYSQELELTTKIGVLNVELQEKANEILGLREKQRIAQERGNRFEAEKLYKQIRNRKDELAEIGSRVAEAVMNKEKFKEAFDNVVSNLDYSEATNPNKGDNKDTERREKVTSVLDLDTSGLTTDNVNDPLKTIERLTEDYQIISDFEVDQIDIANRKKALATQQGMQQLRKIREIENEQMMAAIGGGLTAAAQLFTDAEGRQTAMGKKIASAGALIDTYSAASKVFKQYSAKSLPLATAMAAKATFAGLARVKAINQVQTPFAAGVGPTQAPSIQAPSFNVIGQGSTDANIIAGAIDSQSQQPIQAYVVESEMTSQQELNRNVEENASL